MVGVDEVPVLKMRKDYDSNGWDALVIPNWAVERWVWQAHTNYQYLPEEMKQSDREEAMDILEVLGMMPEPLDEPGVDA